MCSILEPGDVGRVFLQKMLVWAQIAAGTVLRAQAKVSALAVGSRRGGPGQNVLVSLLKA